MANIANLVANLQANITNFQSGMTRASSILTSFSNKAKSTGMAMTAMISLPLIKVGKDAINMGIDAVESENLFSVSMGKMEQKARDWSESYGKALGLNRSELRKNVGMMNTMLGSMGLNEDGAYKMSTSMVQLANDMASFYNLSTEDAMAKLQSGISGEAEPLKRLGIMVNDTTIKQYAMRTGMIKTGQVMTEQQKVIARYGVIMEATKNSQGDLARTMDSPANKLRALKSKWEELLITIGTKFIPMVSRVVDVITGLIDKFNSLSEAKQNQILFWATIFAVAGPVLMLLGFMAGAISSIFTLFSTLAGAVSTIIGWLSGLNLAFLTTGTTIAGFTVPMWAVIAVILAGGASLAFLAINWKESWATMKTYTYTVTSAILTLIQTFVWGIGQALTTMARNVNTVAKGLSGKEIFNIDAIKDMANSALNELKKVTDDYSKKGADALAEADKLQEDRKKNTFMGTGIKLPTITFPKPVIPKIDPPKYDAPPLDPKDWITPGFTDGAKDASKGVDKVAESIDNLSSKIVEMSKSFATQIGLFDKYSRKTVSTATLISRAKRRYETYDEWAKTKDALMRKSELSDSMKAQIGEMGVDQLAELKALAGASSSDLSTWNKYGVGVEGLSKQQAGSAVYQNEINIYANSKDSSSLVDEIYKKLKLKGVKFN